MGYENRCEVLNIASMGRSGSCGLGCAARFCVDGFWMWLCDRHLSEYRHRGLLPKPNLDMASTAELRKAPPPFRPLTPLPDPDDPDSF